MSGLLDKGKEFLSSDSGSSGNTPTQGNQGSEDYADKGFDAVEKKEGISENRATNEKITDGARDEFENVTGCTTKEFILVLRDATLDNGGLDPTTVYRLRNPVQEPLDLSDRFLRLSLDQLLSNTNSSAESYSKSRENITRYFPENEMLSYEQVKKRLADIAEVTSSVKDMCPQSCVVYTGPTKSEKHVPVPTRAQIIWTLPLPEPPIVALVGDYSLASCMSLSRRLPNYMECPE
ncbi:hypothetical protein DFH09DRAFT_1325365 [Mycena vulgaris]|nr:hypothetical protein DFH09DRAFT_1325365 [Mycena vulgaris]